VVKKIISFVGRIWRNKVLRYSIIVGSKLLSISVCVYLLWKYLLKNGHPNPFSSAIKTVLAGGLISTIIELVVLYIILTKWPWIWPLVKMFVRVVRKLFRGAPIKPLLEEIGETLEKIQAIRRGNDGRNITNDSKPVIGGNGTENKKPLNGNHLTRDPKRQP
jgi:hypothetical protein